MRKKTEPMILVEHGVIREDALLAYIHNELSAEQRAELERLLKDDPFAQEALEGLRESNKDKSAAAIISINKKVRERTGAKQARTIKLHWSNYAWAAVVFGLLIGVGFLMVNYMGMNKEIAMNKAPEEQTEKLMEKKVDEPNLVPVTTGNEPVTDSVSVSDQTVAAPQNTAQEIALRADEQKQISGKKIEAEDKGRNATSVTGAGGAAAPPSAAMNSTLTAGDGNVTTTPKAAVAATKTTTTTTGASYRAESEALKAKDKDVKTKNAEEAKKEERKPAKKNENTNLQKAADAAATASETVMRGAVMEKEPAAKVTVITMDDAMKNFNAGDYKTASDQFTEIVKQQPNNADALYFGGISDYINGNSKKSEKNFDKLLKDGTKYVEGSKWYKANILLKKGKRDEAKKLLDELANSGGSYKERAIKKRAEAEF